MGISANLESESIPQLYAPCWVNRTNLWVKRLPGPGWAYYLGLAFVLFLVQTLVSWIEGVFPVGTVLPVQGFLVGVIALFLALFHYLDDRAGAALVLLRPYLTASEESYQELYYKLTSLPNRPVLLASMVILTINILTEIIREPYLPGALISFQVSATLFRILYLVCWWEFGAFLYHTIYQLRLINHIYTKHTQVNLFRMKPFYAFSNLSAVTAGSLALIIYGWLVTNPDVPINDPVVFVWVLVFLIVALVTFLLPQVGMHRLEVAEQVRLLDQAYLRLEATITELHQELDDGNLEKMEGLNFAIASLETELNTLKGIRTWPWEPETLQILVTALALPLGLWIIQFVLERIMGG
jgi:hypothetical protein